MLKHETYVDSVGEFRWRVRAANGKIVADSAEGYHNIEDCRAAWSLICDGVLNFSIESVDLTGR